MKSGAVRPAPPEQAVPPGAGSPAAPAAAAPEPRPGGPARVGPGVWLPFAAAGLCMLSGAAAMVSYAAQYRLVYAARHLAAAALLEAAIPDVAALVFACLGVALALLGRRAVRARLLNVASAGTSVFMNVIAAAPGWRNTAVWAMPPAAYALASDTLIGVVRTGAVARRPAAAGRPGEFSLLAGTAWLALWLLRLAVAPRSTLGGFRAWVLTECPVAPGRRAVPAQEAAPSLSPAITSRASSGTPASRGTGADGKARRAAGSRTETKTARFLALVASEYGPLSAIPLESVARIAAAVAPRADLNSGSARAALRRAVLAAQNGEH